MICTGTRPARPGPLPAVPAAALHALGPWISLTVDGASIDIDGLREAGAAG
jgi:hypothetical protein